MNDEYPIAEGYKIAGFLFAALALPGGIWLLYLATRSTFGGLVFFLFLGLVLIFLSIFFYRQGRLLRITVDDYTLEARDAFSTKSIPLKEIDGYRCGEKQAFYIVAKNGGQTLKIAETVARRKDLIRWIKEKYSDVDERARKAEERNMLEDHRFGSTGAERKANLQRVVRIAGISFIAGVGLLIWTAVYPRPFGLLTTLLLLAPLVGGYFVWHFNGLMRLSARKSSPYPSVTLAIVMPVAALVIAMVLGYDLYSFPSSAWQLLAGAALVLTFAALAAFHEAISAEKRKALVVVCIFVVSAAYSYGLLTFSNCYYDRSAAQVWHVAVTGKRTSHGKSTSYYLELSPWGKYAEGKEIGVSRTFYEAVNDQDTLKVFLRKGKWGIPWYRVVRQDN